MGAVMNSDPRVLLPIIVAVKPQTTHFEPPKTLGTDIIWTRKIEWTEPFVAIEYRADNYKLLVIQTITTSKDFDIILIHRGLPASYNVDKLLADMLSKGEILGVWEDLAAVEADNSKIAKDVAKLWPVENETKKMTWLAPESAGKAELVKVKEKPTSVVKETKQ
jgi:hypothetical protein